MSTSLYKCVQVTSSQPRFPIFAYIYLQVHTNLCKQLHSGLNNQFLHAYIYKYIQVCASDSILAFNSNSCMQISTSSYKCVQATSIWHKLPCFAYIYRQVYTNVYKSQHKLPIFWCIYLQVHTNVCKWFHPGLNNLFLHANIYKFIQIFIFCLHISTSIYKCL